MSTMEQTCFLKKNCSDPTSFHFWHPHYLIKEDIVCFSYMYNMDLAPLLFWALRLILQPRSYSGVCSSMMHARNLSKWRASHRATEFHQAGMHIPPCLDVGSYAYFNYITQTQVCSVCEYIYIHTNSYIFMVEVVCNLTFYTGAKI